MRRILLGVFILLLVTVSVFGQDRGIYPQTGDKFIYKVKEHDVERTIEISIVKPGAISRVNLGGTEGDLIAFTSFTRTGSFPAIEREKLEKALPELLSGEIDKVYYQYMVPGRNRKDRLFPQRGKITKDKDKVINSITNGENETTKYICTLGKGGVCEEIKRYEGGLFSDKLISEWTLQH